MDADAFMRIVAFGRDCRLLQMGSRLAYLHSQNDPFEVEAVTKCGGVDEMRLGFKEKGVGRWVSAENIFGVAVRQEARAPNRKDNNGGARILLCPPAQRFSLWEAELRGARIACPLSWCGFIWASCARMDKEAARWAASRYCGCSLLTRRIQKELLL